MGKCEVWRFNAGGDGVWMILNIIRIIDFVRNYS